MLSGVDIICFAASYGIALLLEVSRLVFRSGVRGAVMLGFAGAGLLAHTALLYYRAVKEAGLPLSSEQDWYLLAAWLVVAVYLYLVYYHPRTHFGLFLLPLALGLIAAGKYLADPEPFAREPASRVWGAIHGVSLVLGAVAVLVGFVTALMYLRQVWRLKHKMPPGRGLRLPSLEWLQRANSRAVVAAMLLLGVGVASGAVLGVIGSRAAGVTIPWYDPLVMATNLTLAWLVVTVAVGAWYRPAQAGRKVAYLTVVSFVLLLVALGVMLLAETEHGGQRAVGSGKWGVGSEELELVRKALAPSPSPRKRGEGNRFWDKHLVAGDGLEGSFRVQRSRCAGRPAATNLAPATGRLSLPTPHTSLPTSPAPGGPVT